MAHSMISLARLKVAICASMSISLDSSGAAAEATNWALQQRYRWQYNVVPLLKLPGVKNVDHNLPLREKLRRATTKSIWPDSAIVEVELIRSDARTAAPETVSAPDDSQRRG
jgi:hypothetical protein